MFDCRIYRHIVILCIFINIFIKYIFYSTTGVILELQILQLVYRSLYCIKTGKHYDISCEKNCYCLSLNKTQHRYVRTLFLGGRVVNLVSFKYGAVTRI